MKPPVEAPTSSARRARGVDAEIVERVGELDAAAADVRMIGDVAARRRRRRRHCAPAFETTWPSTVTCPARISARARSRDGGEAAIDERDVETSLLGGHRSFVESGFSRANAAGKSRPLRDGQLRRDTTQSAIGASHPSSSRAARSVSRARLEAIGGQRARTIEAEERGISRLRRRAASLPAVFPSSAALPSTSRMSSTIWKASPTSVAKRSIAVDGGLGAASHDGAAHGGRANDCSGLPCVHALEAVGVERQRMSGRLAGCLQIDRLAANHADGAGRFARSTSSASSLRCVIAASALTGSRASSANASACSPSPARIAMPSP